MSWVHRFLVVPAANVAVARSLVKTLAPPPSADGMWLTGLNASGVGTPTHWVSSGLIQDSFAAILGNAAMTYGAYQAAGGTTVTLAQITALYNAAVIRTDLDYVGGAQAGIAALNLKLIGGAP